MLKMQIPKPYAEEKPVILMIAGKSDSGKGTVAELLEQKIKDSYKYDDAVLRCSLSSYIREITKKDFYWDGIITSEARRFMAEVYRLGTELIYKYHMARRLWEREIIPFVQESSFFHPIIIIESFREAQNYEYFKQLFEEGLVENLLTIRVERPGYANTAVGLEDHVSENDLDDFEFNFYVYNTGTLEELSEKIDELMKFLYERGV
jgi:hypothetical protein